MAPHPARRHRRTRPRSPRPPDHPIPRADGTGCERRHPANMARASDSAHPTVRQEIPTKPVRQPFGPPRERAREIQPATAPESLNRFSGNLQANQSYRTRQPRSDELP
ncbi:hypothetical protein FRACA_1230015 [Frankia canadensis]|uniref:Uncharacterized protein n=1 Tax=Frankia canadensis TaxID=1836972 RepID=A0A2I2KK60_9ACTN|nr:hypothetical protein FRACA_1230015 [Frankia canadensis]SOU53349.1 hypothetical protein FRACA_1230015 [Frankia canadensis]